MSDKPKPSDSYRDTDRCCFNCRHSIVDKDWHDLTCKLWEVAAGVFNRISEHGTCDLWEGEE